MTQDPATGPTTGPPAELARGIAIELRRHATDLGRRRSLPPQAHVGRPGIEQLRLAEGGSGDHGLLADLVERGLDGVRVTDGCCAWVTRTGALDPVDSDLRWFRAARAGFGRHGIELPAFFVLNRCGWLDLVSGGRRTWTRIRPLPRAPRG